MTTGPRLLLLMLFLATISFYLWYSQTPRQYSVPPATIIEMERNQTLLKSLIDDITLLKMKVDHLEKKSNDRNKLEINDTDEPRNDKPDNDKAQNDEPHNDDKMKHIKGAVLILACDRPKNLNLSLYSINEAKRRSNTIERDDPPIFVSFDCKHNETINIARSWNNRMNITVLFSRGIDNIGGGTLWRIKNHWLYAINRLFMEFLFDYVIYLEDDHVISLDFFDTANVLISYVLNGYITKDISHDIFSISLGQHQLTPFDKRPNQKDKLYKVTVMNATSNIAVIHLKRDWLKFLKYIDIFCSIGDGWDISLASLRWTTPSLSNYTLFAS